jgi:hypothetical protein
MHTKAQLAKMTLAELRKVEMYSRLSTKHFGPLSKLTKAQLVSALVSKAKGAHLPVEACKTVAKVAKKAAAKKSPGKKGPGRPRKSAAKKSPAKKSPAKKSPAKKSPAKKSPAKKSPAKKSPGKKAVGRPRKSPAKKSAAKKSAAKKAGRPRKSPAKKSPAKKYRTFSSRKRAGEKLGKSSAALVRQMKKHGW